MRPDDAARKLAAMLERFADRVEDRRVLKRNPDFFLRAADKYETVLLVDGPAYGREVKVQPGIHRLYIPAPVQVFARFMADDDAGPERPKFTRYVYERGTYELNSGGRGPSRYFYYTETEDA